MRVVLTAPAWMFWLLGLWAFLVFTGTVLEIVKGYYALRIRRLERRLSSLSNEKDTR